MHLSNFAMCGVCLFGLGNISSAWSATHSAASCSSGSVAAVIASATAGDTIVVPAGACTWSSPISLGKSLVVQGAGIDKTTISGNGFSIPAGIDDYRITGFTFNGSWASNYIITNAQSRIGNKRFRIDHNKFMNKAYTTSGTIVFHGFSYGLLDHNVFQDTLDEILSFGGDGAPASTRTPIVGGYENGTIFVEDNQFLLTNACRDYYAPDPNGAAENLFDGNSAPRIVFRYNTITDHVNCRWLSAIETHGFESEFSTVGDARAVYAVEIYNNTFTSNYAGSAGAIKLRGLQGGGVIFNNTFAGMGHSFASFILIQNLRSHTTDDTGSLSKGNINSAGYAEFCHARQADEAALICEHCTAHTGLCFGQVNNLYIWNNANAGTVAVESIGFTQNDVLLNTHYFLSSMPGYTPYPYPHPLANDGPPPPANLRIQ